MRYWKSSPPVHQTLAVFLGVGEAERKKASNAGAATATAPDFSKGELEQHFGPARARFTPPIPIQGAP